MTTLAPDPFHRPAMPYPPSHPRHYNGDPGPSQPSSASQRLLSQVLPLQAPPSSSQLQLQQNSIANSSATAEVSSSASFTVQRAAHSLSSNAASSPPTSTSQYSHPPPPPPRTPSHSARATPQQKRARLHYDFGTSPTSTTTPLPSIAAASLVSPNTHITSSTATSAVRPLSGIARPLPMPPTPTPPQRSPRSVNSNQPLQPLPHRSVHDFEKLIPQRRPPPPIANGRVAPQRTLLQAIPPQPPPVQPAVHHPAPAPDRRPPPPSIDILPHRPESLLTGFRSLDLDLDRIAEIASLEHAHAHNLPTSHSAPGTDLPQWLHTSRGLPSGSIIEAIGPPGSGKSSFVVQTAVTERLRSLARARRSLEHQDSDQDTSQAEIDRQRPPSTDTHPHAIFFTDDFWDAEVASADQVLLIDCEGALTPEKIADAAWSTIASLWSHAKQQNPANDATGRADAAAPDSVAESRAGMPEVVRRLVAAVLAGTHINRVTSTASLVALLISLRPTDELQDGQALPCCMPPRTSLILIDSLSYHLRLSGASSSDRKANQQLSERIRDMLLRLQKPFEHRPKPDLGPEERDAARQRATQAAQKLCLPTIIFTNQMGMRRDRAELESSGRNSPSGWAAASPGSRSFRKNAPRGEGSSMLAPLLNGQRPPQPATIRDAPPAPSVALCGPEMGEDGEALLLPRMSQQAWSRASGQASPQLGHDRGWPPSFLGQDVWRILLFRHGTAGRRFAQIVSIPPAVQSELSELWVQTRARARACASAASGQDANTSTSSNDVAQAASDADGENEAASSISAEEQLARDKDQRILELLAQLRASLYRWRPFHVASAGLIS
ncbi:uncharacterized protein PAN0_004d2251 [Moesziomyces antarcticus]|uniref:Uncharacterized protein n=2 Tax=Pseudozyma antarctica TaxID=84753 RepID=A0A5C3FK53_PSEA2|nr:uncharacterized protein PAN0_004d2251 [Moesziomyces antarcticus]GAK64042.1 conserved hypothetical protein [Moesziomyces antarcticus]SPO44742.1 uncharacterized protein PSANT_02428 [Moesziomyces antarcticus]